MVSSQAAQGPLAHLAIGAKATVAVSIFEEATWDRVQVHPTDSLIDNWHVDMDGAYDLTIGAGVTIPLFGFFFPNVPLTFEETWECCRVELAD